MTTTATLSRPTAANAKRIRAKATTSNLVQQTFQWDASQRDTPSKSKSKSAEADASLFAVPQKSGPLVVSRGSSERVGHCEQAGGLMEKVLSRYGISPEELRLAVEELRASRAMISR